MLAVGILTMAGAVPAGAEAPSEAGAKMLRAYDAMHASLAGDSMEGVQAAADELAAQAAAAAPQAKNGAAFSEVAAKARATAAQKEIEAARESFRDLSKAMAKLVESGELAGAGIFYCPMADGYWLQKTGDDSLRNPYYGKSMLQCGEKVAKVKEG